MPPRFPCVLALALVACASKQTVQKEGAPAPQKVAPLKSELPRGRLLRTSRGGGFLDLLAAVQGAPVVYVGETRGNADHQLLELRLAEYLLDRSSLNAIGLDAAPRSAQAALDRWVKGKADAPPPGLEDYAELLRFAQRHALPLVALGVEAELVARYRERGADGLPEELRRKLPALPEGASLRHEVAAQALLDWFATAPEEATVLVIAPAADVVRRGGLVRRVRERSGKPGKLVVAVTGEARPEQHDQAYADFVWFTPR